MLYVMFVLADGLVWEKPNGKNSQNKQGDNYTKDSHTVDFICSN